MCSLLDYTITRTLGRNTSLVQDKCENVKVIHQKVLTQDEMKNIGDFRQRVQDIQKCLDCPPNFLKIEDTVQSGDTLYFVTEYCAGGSLLELINRARHYGDVLNEAEIMEWFIQTVQIVQHLHSRGLVHGSICARYLLLEGNSIRMFSPSLIISMLGFHLEDWRPAFQCDEEPIPPDLPTPPDAQVEPSFSGDILALGDLLYHMCFLKKPDLNRTGSADSRTSSFSEHYSSELADLWRSLSNLEPDERPKINEILNTPFLLRFLTETKKNADDWAEYNAREALKKVNLSKLSGCDQGGRKKPNPDLVAAVEEEGYNSDDNYLTEDDIKELIGS